MIKVLLAISLVLHWQSSKSSIVFWQHKCFSKQHITNHISLCYSECTFIHEICLKLEHHVTSCSSSSPFILCLINLLFKIFSLITHFMLSVSLLGELTCGMSLTALQKENEFLHDSRLHNIFEQQINLPVSVPVITL